MTLAAAPAAADLSLHLAAKLPSHAHLPVPVDVIAAGRRNNPPDGPVPPLCSFNPLHFMELTELFMEFIPSLSVKSPSTTGAGAEGALAKGPFNALTPKADLNNALVSFSLCGHDGYSTAAGHIGAERRVDHDISFLMPEIWCRLAPRERDAKWLIERGYLEPVRDFEHAGRNVLASRLGYRITPRFMHAFLGKIFDDPVGVFDDAMLRPETQDLDSFVEGVEHIVAAQEKVAKGYLADGSVADACPPLKALLHIMAEGRYQGMDLAHPDIRRMFTREALLESDWYRERLGIKQRRDAALYRRHVDYLQGFLAEADVRCEPNVIARCQAALEEARSMLAHSESPAYPDILWSGLGADWVHRS